MPTLHWIGKEKVINHHQEVPFRILEHKYHFSADQEQVEAGAQPAGTVLNNENAGADTAINTETNGINSGNKIIHGDNLEALKSLLPEYEGRVKCIYIDPPYNTGNEGWAYNDNVNHPKLNKWLHKVVGKEGEDLSRHDKWLCMMYPRLQLLHKLLAQDGAIFISIDDNEQANLKLIMDEIFGRKNQISTFTWRRRTSSQMSLNNVSNDHEYILCYSKKEGLKLKGVNKDYANYSNPDNDPNGPWTLGDLTVGMTKDQRPNQFYDLVDPITGKSYKPNPKRVWTYVPETMEEKIQQGRVKFPENGKGRPMYKRYSRDLNSEINPISSWLSSETYKIGLNSEGTKILQNIFGDKTFDYPKPVSVVSNVINQITSSNDIILDSFAGSGTTAHAVLNLNKQDGGNRKFILVEMEDYADKITAERVKRVMQGYSNTEGTGSSFDFYEVGEPLFDDYHNLNENIPTQKIRDYIWYSETKSQAQTALPHDNIYLLGIHEGTSYYFYYEKDALTTLSHEFLSTVGVKAQQYIIYADNCILPKDFMAQHNIVFKKIPRDITRF